jgi:hypothetical protein
MGDIVRDLDPCGGGGSVDAEQHDRNEDRVRRIARRQGYALHKDKAGVWSFNHQGGWQIVDAVRNWLVVGERFDLSLDDVEQWLSEDQEATATRARTA